MMGKPAWMNQSRRYSYIGKQTGFCKYIFLVRSGLMDTTSLFNRPGTVSRSFALSTMLVLTAVCQEAVAVGAIAIDQNWVSQRQLQRPPVGATINYTNEAEAKAEALRQCGRPGCTVVGTFYNACMGYAYDGTQGSSIWSVASIEMGYNRDFLRQEARNICRQRGGQLCVDGVVYCDEVPEQTAEAGQAAEAERAAQTPARSVKPSPGDPGSCVEWLFDQGYTMETQVRNHCNRPVYLSYCYTRPPGYNELSRDDYCKVIGETAVVPGSLATLININEHGGSVPPGAGSAFRPSEVHWRSCFHDEYSGFARPKFKYAYEEFDVLGTQLETGGVIEGGRTIGEYMAPLTCDPRQQPKELPASMQQADTGQPDAEPDQTALELLRETAETKVSELVGEMVAIPAGSFRMGDMSDDGYGREKPVHSVTVSAFRLGKHEVTFAQWDACVADGGCGGYTPDDRGWGRGKRPVIYVSWDDIQGFIKWLNGRTGGKYRLPTEAEWEYAARAGSTTKYSWGNSTGSNRANCRLDYCGDRWEYTAPVASFSGNAWGLHDMQGNVWEWVEDCWNGSYKGAPTNGSAWMSGDCGQRVLRGGSWFGEPWDLRSAGRLRLTRSYRGDNQGFRLAQDP